MYKSVFKDRRGKVVGMIFHSSPPDVFDFAHYGLFRLIECSKLPQFMERDFGWAVYRSVG